MKTKFLAFSLVLINSISCHKQSIPTKVFVSNIEKIECTQPDSITEFYTYYQGEKIDFEYTPIALISVIKGNKRDSIDLKSNLKYHAVLNCADAIINLNQSYDQGTYKKTNYLYNQYSQYHKQNLSFDMLSYHGLAVKLKTKAGLRKDDSFVHNYSKTKKDINDMNQILAEKYKNNFSTLGALFGLSVVGIMYLITVRPF